MSKEDKILTISIAAFNIAEYIDNTVASLVMDEEHMKKLEVIIINDGSTDETSRKAHSWADKYPQTIKVVDKQNGGYGSTINTSLPVAEGKYYKLLDGDDWYDTENLQRLMDYLCEIDSDIVISPYYEITDKKKIVDAHAEIPDETTSINGIEIKDKQFAMHEIAVRSELLKAYNRQIAEKCFYTDSEYVFHIMCAAKTISRFNKGVYMYRLDVDEQSVSLKGIRKHYKDLLVVAERIISAHEECESKAEGEKKKILNWCVENITYNAYRAYLLLDNSRQKKKELKDFDKRVRTQYRKEYEIGNRSRLVGILRKTHFFAYGLESKIAIYKYIRCK